MPPKAVAHRGPAWISGPPHEHASREERDVFESAVHRRSARGAAVVRAPGDVPEVDEPEPEDQRRGPGAPNGPGAPAPRPTGSRRVRGRIITARRATAAGKERGRDCRRAAGCWNHCAAENRLVPRPDGRAADTSATTKHDDHAGERRQLARAPAPARSRPSGEPWRGSGGSRTTA